MIKLDDVSFSYEEREIICNASLEIKKSSFIGIVGENGTGKTTLLKLILGLEKPICGSITISEGDTIAYVRQTSTGEEGNFPASVEEIATLGILKGKKLFLPKERRELVKRSIAGVGLSGCEKKMFSELSGGQKQRLKIAMALAERPTILILDEPTAGLDEKARLGLLELIHSLRKKGVGILMVTHRQDDLKEASEIYRLSDKKLEKESQNAPI